MFSPEFQNLFKFAFTAKIHPIYDGYITVDLQDYKYGIIVFQSFAFLSFIYDFQMFWTTLTFVSTWSYI